MRTIILKPNGVGRYDDVSPFIVAGNKLELKVELPNFNGEFYFVAKIGGTIQKRLLPRDGVVAFENLTAGELNAEIKHYLKGTLIKSYKVEPLILKELDVTLSAMPEMEELNRRICAVERIQAAQLAREEELLKRFEKAEANMLALARFAFKDNTENPYLDGLTLEKFLKEYGFILSEEQIQAIKGDKGNEKD